MSARTFVDILQSSSLRAMWLLPACAILALALLSAPAHAETAAAIPDPGPAHISTAACVDADGDGVFAPPCGNDCNDNDPRNFPGNVESCTDGTDNNCNGLADCQDQACLTPPQPCNDGNLCTGQDRCQFSPTGGGICVGQPVTCDDNNLCTNDFCTEPRCVARDNGAGTADLPPPCPYISRDKLQIISGLPPGSRIDIDAVLGGFFCPAGPSAVCSFPAPLPGLDCSQPGGTLLGDEGCADGGVSLHMVGAGALLGYTRNMNLTAGVEMHSAPRPPFAPFQSFDTDLFRWHSQTPIGDPDFDLLRITAGTDFGLPSPGHMTLTQLPGARWAVDSFFDITYRIDFVGAIGGPLAGMSGSTTGTVRFSVDGGGCQHAAITCDDQNPCTSDRCNPTTGLCESDPISCDDGNPCTRDFCDPTFGCVHLPDPGAPCDDGNACTGHDQCVQLPGGPIGCQGIPVTCDDQNPCTTDTCDPQTGLCTFTPLVCDDGNQCTADTCDPSTGGCRFTPTPGKLCDDGDTCTENDRCVLSPTGGIGCVGSPVTCDDGDLCTSDFCLPGGASCVVPDNGSGTAELPPQGCAYSGVDHMAIIDGLPAGSTLDIAAKFGSFSCPPGPVAVCTFPAPVPGVDCSDAGGSMAGEKACADASLTMQMFGTGAFAGYVRVLTLPLSLEMHAAPRTPGDPVQPFNTTMFRWYTQLLGDPDFDLLRITAGTDFGLPSPGDTVLAQLGSGWAVDSFFDITYRIDFVGKPGGTFSGMSGSTTGTSRFALGDGGCMNIPINCEDGDPCTLDRCNPTTGGCESAPVSCDDNNPCTMDRCDPTTGQCTHDPVNCDDQNPCTMDQCNPTTGACEHPPVSCDDNDPCTMDQCSPASGQCTHTPLSCDDQNPCTTDSCDPVTGACKHVPVNCDDNNPCTMDQCSPAVGQCVHTPVSCDDQNVCTADSCNPTSGGCIHQPIPPPGDPNPLTFMTTAMFVWPPNPGATHWNSYRGTIPPFHMGTRPPGLIYDHVCFESDDTNGDGPTVSIDPAIPPPNNAFYYVSSAESPCGESGVGASSSGVPRPLAAPCPTPP